MNLITRIFTILSLSLISISAFGNEVQKIKIVCLGDSLTEGYGISREKAYPALLQAKFDSKYKDQVEVINAGISGSTTASAESRLKWFLKTKPEILFLALGANDGLRGVDVDETRKNIEAAIKTSKDADIRVVLGGMKLPPNYGRAAAKKFDAIYPELSKKYGIGLVPFILEGVGGVRSLNIEDGIHPNEEGHEKVAALIFPYLEKEVEKIKKEKK